MVDAPHRRAGGLCGGCRRALGGRLSGADALAAGVYGTRTVLTRIGTFLFLSLRARSNPLLTQSTATGVNTQESSSILLNPSLKHVRRGKPVCSGWGGIFLRSGRQPHTGLAF